MTIDELLKEEHELNARKHVICAMKLEKQQEILETIAAESDIQFISITGYTPGFNDGEPCTHSSMVAYTYDQLADYGYETAVTGLVEDGDEDDLTALDPKEPVSDRVKELLYILEDNANYEHETNYRVTWHREGDKFVGGELEEYWCGY